MDRYRGQSIAIDVILDKSIPETTAKDFSTIDIRPAKGFTPLRMCHLPSPPGQTSFVMRNSAIAESEF